MTTHAVPPDWQSEHLFVLVGGNPLPNYVAGKLLLKQGGTLHLVHTPETAEVAERIALVGGENVRHARHQVQDASDSREVQTVLRGALDSIPSGASIGLNYTGGTKAMAVHAHSTIHGIHGVQREARGKATFTYLDARTLTLRRDDTGESRDVQLGTKPAITTLLALHGIELESGEPRRTEARRMELNQALARAHESEQGQDVYERWCQQNLRYLPNKRARICRKALDDALDEDASQLADIERNVLHDRLLLALRGTPCCRGELVKSPSQFPSLPMPILFPTDPALQEVVEAMRRTFMVQGDSFDPKQVVDNKEVGFKDCRDLVKYLDGDWVEHLALAAFSANMAKHHIHDAGMCLRTTKASYDFEFDVAAMQGYQLYAVSCTRSNERGLCKSKLFEAYVRAAQLGGDEAKVGLVCCDKTPGVLEQQVTELWRAERGRIRVFGAHDLPNLADRFADWLSF